MFGGGGLAKSLWRVGAVRCVLGVGQSSERKGEWSICQFTTKLVVVDTKFY